MSVEVVVRCSEPHVFTPEMPCLACEVTRLRGLLRSIFDSRGCASLGYDGAVVLRPEYVAEVRRELRDGWRDEATGHRP